MRSGKQNLGLPAVSIWDVLDLLIWFLGHFYWNIWNHWLWILELRTGGAQAGKKEHKKENIYSTVYMNKYNVPICIYYILTHVPCDATESKCWFLMVSKHLAKLAKHLVFGGLGKKWLQSANMVSLECWNGTGAKHTVYSIPPPCSLQTMDIVGPTLKQKHMFQTQHWQTEWTQESKPSWLTLPWFWCVSHSTSFACCFANQLDLTDFPPGCHDWAVLRRVNVEKNVG